MKEASLIRRLKFREQRDPETFAFDNLGTKPTCPAAYSCNASRFLPDSRDRIKPFRTARMQALRWSILLGALSHRCCGFGIYRDDSLSGHGGKAPGSASPVHSESPPAERVASGRLPPGGKGFASPERAQQQSPGREPWECAPMQNSPERAAQAASPFQGSIEHCRCSQCSRPGLCCPAPSGLRLVTIRTLI